MMMCRYYHQTRSISLVPFSELTGTMGYMAPEIMSRKMFDTAVDMWSLGVLLYQVRPLLLVFRFLFPSNMLGSYWFVVLACEATGTWSCAA